MAAPCLELIELTKSFHGRPAVDGLSLSFSKGEIAALLGPNGAGKSTTINVLSTFITPTSGEILWEGRSIRGAASQWRKEIGVVLEDLSLFEFLTVREQLILVGRLYGLSAVETERRTGELLEFLRLEESAGTIAREASQGTRKKLAFGLGIIHAPRFLFLDEALNGIDAVVVRDLKDLLKKSAAHGTTILISSHVLDAVQTLADRCVIMKDGRVVLDSPLTAILESGRSLEDAYSDTVAGGRGQAPSWV